VETEITLSSVKGEIAATRRTTDLIIPSCIAKFDSSEKLRDTGETGYVIAIDVTPSSSAPPSRTLDPEEETKATRGLQSSGLPLILKVEGEKR